MSRAVVLDLITGDVFSETLGWNQREASVRPAGEWCEILFNYQILIRDTKIHKNRCIISVQLPCEQERFTGMDTYYTRDIVSVRLPCEQEECT